MRTVITYGSYDLIHQGHINLLRRAKELGDYLIVGVTSEDFDINRGKINTVQSMMERIQGVKDTGFADLVIPEEYVGQKIDDILKYDVDVFAIGSDWEGYFDYLKQYCEVVYLERTKGISSTAIREKQNRLEVGIVGDSVDVEKFIRESKYVSGVKITSLLPHHEGGLYHCYDDIAIVDELEELLDSCQAVYVANRKEDHYETVKAALLAGKHVLCKSPVALSEEDATELFDIAEKQGVVLFDAIKTAYSLAFSRMLLMVKSGRIGKVTSIQSTCTSLTKRERPHSSLSSWGATAALPIFSLLGVDYKRASAVARKDDSNGLDTFVKYDFLYEDATATMITATGAKSEGSLVICGTNAYVYVPSPWWKTDYFEIRYENFSENKRFFHQLHGEGIRFEISTFARAVRAGEVRNARVTRDVSVATAKLIGEFLNGSAEIDEIK